jgi:tetratricopeptide (TPR) repeat protein
VLLDRKRVKFWQKWVFAAMAILMAGWLVTIPLSNWMGCSDTASTTNSLDDQIARLERQIAASPAALDARLDLAEALRRRANQSVQDSQEREDFLRASAVAYEAYVKRLAKVQGTKAERREAERQQVAALEDLVSVYLSLGDYAEVTRVYGMLTELRPNKADYFYDMGRVAINAADTDTALLAFARYLDLAPDSPQADQVQEWIDENAPKGGDQ